MLSVNMAEKLKRGRPPLPEHQKRVDFYCVRLNSEERRRLQRLSGLLDLVRLADVFREGLMALEEREASKAGPPSPPPAPVCARKPR